VDEQQSAGTKNGNSLLLCRYRFPILIVMTGQANLYS